MQAKEIKERASVLMQTMQTASDVQPTSETPTQVLDPLKFVLDMTTPVPLPLCRLRIEGKGLITADDITTITGHAKNGKSQFLTIAAAVMLSGRPFGHMERGDIETNRILFVDTEQSESTFYQNMCRLYDIAGWQPNTPAASHGLYPLPISRLSGKEKLELIDASIELFKPDVVIIDGLRDLIDDFNDNTQCQYVMTWVNTLIKEHPNISILPVLHQNPKDTKIRGTLGTELEHKSYTVVSVKQEETYFKMECPLQRGVPVPEFYFHFVGSSLQPIQHPSFVVSVEDAAESIYKDNPEGISESNYKALLGKTLNPLKPVTGPKLNDAFTFLMLNGIIYPVNDLWYFSPEHNAGQSVPPKTKRT